MIKIKEEKTRVEIVNKYKAFDGTIFNDETECAKYEDSATCAIKAIINRMSKNGFVGIIEDSWFVDCFENEMTIVVPKTIDDIKSIIQYSVLVNGEKNPTKITEESIGKHVAIITNECNDWSWTIVVEDFIDQLKKKMIRFDESEK